GLFIFPRLVPRSDLADPLDVLRAEGAERFHARCHSRTLRGQAPLGGTLEAAIEDLPPDLLAERIGLRLRVDAALVFDVEAEADALTAARREIEVPRMRTLRPAPR